MAVNLVSAVWRELTPEVVARLALLLGLDARSTRTAVAAAVPALLAGLVGTAAAPGGAQKLALAVSEHRSIGADFTTMLADGHHTSLVDAGTQRLAFLLGPAQDALATAVADYAGVTAGTANSLIGALAPLTLGVIGKQAENPEAAADLLATQQGHIVESLPAGFFDQLKRGGIIEAFGTAAVARQRNRAAAAAPAPAQRYAPLPERPGYGWVYWLLALLAILGVGWYFLVSQVTRPVPPSAPPTATVLDMRPFSATFETIRTSFAGVRDPRTARAALPELEAAAARIDLLSGALDQASPAQQAPVREAIGPMAGTLTELCEEVRALPGVATVLRPVLDDLEAELAAFRA